MSDYANNSDADLIMACRQGQDGAWRALVARYERLVYAIPLRYGLTATEAEDVFQSTWLALLDHLDNLREPERVAAWLTTTARRATWDRRRNPSFVREMSVADESVLDRWSDSISPEEIVARFDAFRQLERALAQLGERCRRLLWLLFQAPDKPSYQSISKQLAIPVGAIGPTRARCLAQLRRVMGR